MDAIIRAWQLLQASKHLNPISLKELQAYHTIDELLNEGLEDLVKRDLCIKAVALIQVGDEEQIEARDAFLNALTSFNTDVIKPVIVVKTNKIIPVSIYISEETSIEEPTEAVYPVSIIWGGGDNG